MRLFLCLLLSTAATATQAFDAERYIPSSGQGPYPTLETDDAGVQPMLRARMVMGYAHLPVVARPGKALITNLGSGWLVLNGHLLGSVDVRVVASGSVVPPIVGNPLFSGFRLRDPRLFARWAPLRHRLGSLAVEIGGRVGLSGPTLGMEGHWGGHLAVAGRFSPWEFLRVDGELSGLASPGWQSQVRLRVGAAWTPWSWLAFPIEFDASWYPRPHPRVGNALPAEVRTGVVGRWKFMEARFDVSAGLTTGVGAPLMRGVASIGFFLPTRARKTLPPAVADGFVHVVLDGPEAMARATRVDAADGSRLGRATGAPLQLAPGRHTLTVTLPNDSKRQIDIDIQPGQETWVRVPLPTPQAHVIAVVDEAGRPLTSEMRLGDQPCRPRAGGAVHVCPVEGDVAVTAVVSATGHHPARLRSAPSELPDQVTLLKDRQPPTGASCVSALSAERATVFFDTSEHALRPDAIMTLGHLLMRLGGLKVAAVDVVGHADHRGTEDDNWGLSGRRGRVIQRWLRAHGIEAPVRVTAAGEAPWTRGDLALQTDRRVDVLVHLEPTSAPAGPAQNNTCSEPERLRLSTMGM